MLSASGLKNWRMAKEEIDELARGIQGAGMSEEGSLDIQPEIGEFKSTTASVLKQWEDYEKTLELNMLDDPILPSNSGFQDTADSTDPSTESWVSPDADEEMEVEEDWTIHRGQLAGEYSEREQKMIYREMNIMLGFMGGYLTIPKDEAGYILTLPTHDKLERMREEALKNFHLRNAKGKTSKNGPFIKESSTLEPEQSGKNDPKVKLPPKVQEPKNPKEKVPPKMPKENRDKEPARPEPATLTTDTDDGFDIVENVWDYGMLGFDSGDKQARFQPDKMGWTLEGWRAAARELDPCAAPGQFFELMIKKSPKRTTYRRKYKHFNFSF
ncbi:phosphoprotein [Leman virus]|uniref:Phosphoprotein n=1 Tax=Leman virus TaxID=3071226 RepID=A0AAE6XMW2_9RHAB|nr:phosphoprotein [Perhabdovirus perca]QIQ19246.1 phosphoprotein [Leman virus]